MKSDLAQILILSEQPGWQSRLSSLHKALLGATYFTLGDANHSSLLEILNTVNVKGDAAVIEYTNRFDDVKLSPDQLRVSSETMADAHSKMEPKLLSSLRKAIDNVRAYQKEIFVGKDKKCDRGCAIEYRPIS